MLLLKINRKPYMGGPMAASQLTLSDLDSQSQSTFKALYLINYPS